MQIAQRMVLLIAILMTVMWMGLGIWTEDRKKKVYPWIESRTEIFLEKIKKDQTLSIQEYESYIAAIKVPDISVSIELEVYQKEWDMDGHVYYYLISDEEIFDCLLQNGFMNLEEEQFICIKIYHENMEIKKYYALFPGKDRNAS